MLKRLVSSRNRADGASIPQTPAVSRDVRVVSSIDEDQIGQMTAVSISELQANLSRYVREVRRGGEVQVLDRGTPVARLIPITTDGDGIRERLISEGVVRPGRGGAGALLREPLLALPVSVGQALADGRDDRL
ncbi:MAG: type II toxin-antitoxin system prevent-host-death family antitoxin [Gammaproteobacteria bacterium]|nr:type II toxin-antitoxin system prevent-host-death family antitoxin [Gammaproteobacteria bacterium]